MGLNSLQNLDTCIDKLSNEILLEDSIIQKAKIPLDKMINFNV
jgi:quinolinate synthase